jgi:hypothetical protein
VHEDLDEEKGIIRSSDIKDSNKEYLYWHFKLGHLSHVRMQQLINRGILPKYLNTKTPPVCVACINGKATRKLWRAKEISNSSKKATYPGQCVAVDQLESSTAGFIGQLRGAILTNRRYRYATVFVDLYSDYTFVYPHVAITADETLKAKKAFELHAESFGVQIKQYLADIRRFQDIKFKEHCIEQSQRLTYCGVNAHFQNGRAERKIRDLQDVARMSLLHAMKKWPTAITINLWPYAMRYVNDINKYVPRKHEKESPIEMFSSTELKAKLHQFHHFGCPVYVLDHNLQSGKKSRRKWKERVRLGINLGFSPQHAKSVHLVLSLTTGCMLLQFHCTFDTTFETLKEYDTPESLWQEKAHFVVSSSKRDEHKERSKQPNSSNDAENVDQVTNNQVTNADDIGNQSQNDEELDPILTTQDELEPPLQQETATLNESEQEEPGVRRSGRIRRTPRRLNDYIMGNKTICDETHRNDTYIEGVTIISDELDEMRLMNLGRCGKKLL